MSSNSDKNFNIYAGWSKPISLFDIKEWVAARIAAGDTELEVDISWGYYNDIDDLILKSK